jgi:hypothetical protein
MANEKTLELTIFSKKRATKDGKKKFFTYFTTMPGRESAIKVKFREECGAPDCPANIILHKGDCNMSKEKFTDGVTGELKTIDVLWVSAYSDGKPYEDKSMEEWF